jgi:nucleoside 2-deoxyribosyltransferase
VEPERLPGAKQSCFVIMPFLPELHYFYLFVKNHLESKLSLECERADSRVRTIPVLEKISGMIRQADVIIADCSGRNANVFYELGLAHAHNKQVVLITKDEITDTPTDIRHFEFIRYALDAHVAFFERLDNALHHVLFEPYEPLYQRAMEIFRQFVNETSLAVQPASKEVFMIRIRTAEQSGQLPTQEEDSAWVEVLLPKIIQESTDMTTMSAVLSWNSRRAK